MTRIFWLLVDRLSQSLERDERDAVLGDLAESGEGAAQAMFDLIGLVVRRQLGSWCSWRPWTALLALVFPLGLLLSLACRWWAEGDATTFFLYVNNWTWGYLETPGARLDLFRNLEVVLVQYAALICWSWTAGFVVARLARRAAWVNGSVFGLVIFGEFLLIRQHHNPLNPLVWSLTFYREVFPFLIRAALVFLPLLWGMRKALRRPTLEPFSAVVGAVAIAIITGLAARDLAISGTAGWSPLRHMWQVRLLPIAAVWPAGFLAAAANWSRWVGRVLSCVLILAIVTGVPVFAHSYTGALTGVIRNWTGSAVAHASVIAKNERTKTEYRSSSDAWGVYNLPHLPMGAYDLTVERRGFKEANCTNVVLAPGAGREEDFSLALAPTFRSGLNRR
ncbi:MAG TPA: carboxypeptidase-like regulatory domain-containing protein [Terriglobia bacterium]|nr:carboxypeptidase-like regulatory domain-containing protein [Terriglobia bacterium]